MSNMTFDLSCFEWDVKLKDSDTHNAAIKIFIVN